MESITLDKIVRKALLDANSKLSMALKGDCIIIQSAIKFPLDYQLRMAIENLRETSKKSHLIVLLETNGGSIETAERLVAIMREHYKKVSFIIPNYAYSAGTVLALSGNKIYMDYYSVLGPIDPQYSNLPGVGLLSKFRELMDQIYKAEHPTQCHGEINYLISRFDPALLAYIEQAVKHAKGLVSEWLVQYKFKDWRKTESKGETVTKKMREQRAEKIAAELGNVENWHSHGRGIHMKALNDMGLKIDDFGADPELRQNIRNYYGLAIDFYGTMEKGSHFVHTKQGARRVEIL